MDLWLIILIAVVVILACFLIWQVFFRNRSSEDEYQDTSEEVKYELAKFIGGGTPPAGKAPGGRNVRLANCIYFLCNYQQHVAGNPVNFRGINRDDVDGSGNTIYYEVAPAAFGITHHVVSQLYTRSLINFVMPLPAVVPPPPNPIIDVGLCSSPERGVAKPALYARTNLTPLTYSDSRTNHTNTFTRYLLDYSHDPNVAPGGVLPARYPNLNLPSSISGVFNSSVSENINGVDHRSHCTFFIDSSVGTANVYDDGRRTSNGTVPVMRQKALSALNSRINVYETPPFGNVSNIVSDARTVAFENYVIEPGVAPVGNYVIFPLGYSSQNTDAIGNPNPHYSITGDAVQHHLSNGTLCTAMWIGESRLYTNDDIFRDALLPDERGDSCHDSERCGEYHDIYTMRISGAAPPTRDVSVYSRGRPENNVNVICYGMDESDTPLYDINAIINPGSNIPRHEIRYPALTYVAHNGAHRSTFQDNNALITAYDVMRNTMQGRVTNQVCYDLACNSINEMIGNYFRLVVRRLVRTRKFMRIDLINGPVTDIRDVNDAREVPRFTPVDNIRNGLVFITANISVSGYDGWNAIRDAFVDTAEYNNHGLLPAVAPSVLRVANPIRRPFVFVFTDHVDVLNFPIPLPPPAVPGGPSPGILFDTVHNEIMNTTANINFGFCNVIRRIRVTNMYTTCDSDFHNYLFKHPLDVYLGTPNRYIQTVVGISDGVAAMETFIVTRGKLIDAYVGTGYMGNINLNVIIPESNARIDNDPLPGMPWTVRRALNVTQPVNVRQCPGINDLWYISKFNMLLIAKRAFTAARAIDVAGTHSNSDIFEYLLTVPGMSDYMADFTRFVMLYYDIIRFGMIGGVYDDNPNIQNIIAGAARAGSLPRLAQFITDADALWNAAGAVDAAILALNAAPNSQAAQKALDLANNNLDVCIRNHEQGAIKWCMNCKPSLLEPNEVKTVIKYILMNNVAAGGVDDPVLVYNRPLLRVRVGAAAVPPAGNIYNANTRRILNVSFPMCNAYGCHSFTNIQPVMDNMNRDIPPGDITGEEFLILQCRRIIAEGELYPIAPVPVIPTEGVTGLAPALSPADVALNEYMSYKNRVLTYSHYVKELLEAIDDAFGSYLQRQNQNTIVAELNTYTDARTLMLRENMVCELLNTVLDAADLILAGSNAGDPCLAGISNANFTVNNVNKSCTNHCNDILNFDTEFLTRDVSPYTVLHEFMYNIGVCLLANRPAAAQRTRGYVELHNLRDQYNGITARMRRGLLRRPNTITDNFFSSDRIIDVEEILSGMTFPEIVNVRRRIRRTHLSVKNGRDINFLDRLRHKRDQVMTYVGANPHAITNALLAVPAVADFTEPVIDLLLDHVVGECELETTLIEKFCLTGRVPSTGVMSEPDDVNILARDDEGLIKASLLGSQDLCRTLNQISQRCVWNYI